MTGNTYIESKVEKPIEKQVHMLYVGMRVRSKSAKNKLYEMISRHCIQQIYREQISSQPPYWY